ncbi:MAG: CDP-glycerol glycerophosphotransferase family protein [Clostridiales bacterium]|nr:CDP-glycerol glycerophosphotransferase family protein [Clostridiales bacterium]
MSGLKNTLYGLVERWTPMRRAARDGVTALRRLQFWQQTRGCVMQEDLVLFCTFGGKGYSDSPRAVYQAMLADRRYDGYRFVWAFQQPERFPQVAAMPRTEVVAYGSQAYNRKMAEAKYWVLNFRVADHIWPKKGQVYVQCWHGTPLKRLGYDIREESNANSMNSLAEIRQKYDLDAAKLTWLLSPSPFATEVFTSAWNLKARGREGTILELGYPRNDFLKNCTPAELEAIRSRLGLTKEQLHGRKVLLYAPTFRDNQHQGGGYRYTPQVDFQRLRRELGEDYVLLFRAHYLVAGAFDFSAYGGFIRNVSDYPDINDLYLVADALITDYSSVFFDYAILGRPEIFYMYDLEDYRDTIRGFYLGLEELPGPIVQTEEALIAAIRGAWTDRSYDERYARFTRRFNPLEDGQAAQRLAWAVFPTETGGENG